MITIISAKHESSIKGIRNVVNKIKECGALCFMTESSELENVILEYNKNLIPYSYEKNKFKERSYKPITIGDNHIVMCQFIRQMSSN